MKQMFIIVVYIRVVVVKWLCFKRGRELTPWVKFETKWHEIKHPDVPMSVFCRMINRKLIKSDVIYGNIVVKLGQTQKLGREFARYLQSNLLRKTILRVWKPLIYEGNSANIC